MTGDRNRTLTILAIRLVSRHHLDQIDVEDAIRAVNDAFPEPLPAREVEEICRRAWSYR